jgi:hypothetical protein
MKLEKEFERAKARHKLAIMRERLLRYYEVVLANTVQLPEFMGGDTPEKCADRALKDLIVTDIDKFNSLYEKAYMELAPEMK